MNPPPKKKPGDPVLASDWNRIVEALAARTPRPSPNLELVSVSGGFAYRLRQSAPGPSVPPHPFKIVTGKDDQGHPVLMVLPGTIEGMMAKLDGTALDADPPPSKLLTNGTWIVWLRIEWTPATIDDYDGNPVLANGGTIAGAPEVKLTAQSAWPPSETMPEPGTNGVFVQRVGMVRVEEGAVTAQGNDTLRASCNAVFCKPSTFYLIPLQ